MLGVDGTLWFGVHQAKYRGNFDVMIYWDLVAAERLMGADSLDYYGKAT